MSAESDVKEFIQKYLHLDKSGDDLEVSEESVSENEDIIDVEYEVKNDETDKAKLNYDDCTLNGFDGCEAILY